MLNPYISIIILLLYHCIPCITANASELSCQDDLGPIRPTVAECRAAINLMPDGTVHLDGTTLEPLQFLLSPNARDTANTPVKMPAGFRSGTCVIRVYLKTYRNNLGTTGEPLRIEGALELYFRIWPEVRRTAEKIVGKCLRGRGGTNGGYMQIRGSLKDERVWYFVRVTGEGENGLKRPWGWSRGGTYEADGRGRTVRKGPY
ncbi:hypothetical protein MMC30_006102 [Trapelia coarctata]|nr:hypothetical protein [Trapelia coarctata]